MVQLTVYVAVVSISRRLNVKLEVPVEVENSIGMKNEKLSVQKAVIINTRMCNVKPAEGEVSIGRS